MLFGAHGDFVLPSAGGENGEKVAATAAAVVREHLLTGLRGAAPAELLRAGFAAAEAAVLGAPESLWEDSAVRASFEGRCWHGGAAAAICLLADRESTAWLMLRLKRACADARAGSTVHS